MPKNLRTSLKKKRRSVHPMNDFDRLPQDLRQWLTEANLPWSPKSTLKLWNKALDSHAGNPVAARAYLSRCEAQKMQKDAPEVWGASYPIDDLARA